MVVADATLVPVAPWVLALACPGVVVDEEAVPRDAAESLEATEVFAASPLKPLGPLFRNPLPGAAFAKATRNLKSVLRRLVRRGNVQVGRTLKKMVPPLIAITASAGPALDSFWLEKPPSA